MAVALSHSARLLSIGLVAFMTLAAPAGAASPAHATQDTSVVIKGRIIDVRTGQPIPSVELGIEGSEIRAMTDSEGMYVLRGVPPGPQVLRARRIGYAIRRIPLNVPLRGEVTTDIELAQSALDVEGITVTGDAVSRATGELGTATVIEAEAIRNQTATSLRGVLELVPGVEAQPPGLDAIQQIGLRAAPTSGSSSAAIGTTAGAAAQFGTIIILDGVPLSNNANLQVPGRGSELFFTTSAGGGVDLRRIPARTIERVEVIRGVPSARYGDLTQGAVIVDTRAGLVEPELSFQLDERTLEGSGVGGLTFGGPSHAFTATLDLARTKSQPGVALDHAERVAGQFAHRIGFGEAPLGAGERHKLLLDTRVDLFQLTDDRPENTTFPDQTLFTRDRGFRVSERARLALSSGVTVSLTASVSRLAQRSQFANPLTRGPAPFTDRLTEGRSEGRYFLGRYVAQATLDGNSGLVFGRLEADAEPDWFGGDHHLRAGFEFRSEWNSGAGYQFDVLNPPQVTFNGVNGFARPRAFESIPALVTGAWYVDDRITAPLGANGLIAVQAGVRLDLLHEGSHWLTAVRDAQLGPRVNLEVSPWRWLRLRGGWGLVTKTPWLAQLYPEPQYYDVINVNWFTNDPAERLAILTTFIEDPTNPDLGFSVAEKAEAGFEVGPGQWAVSVVAFRDRIRDAVAIRAEPGHLLRDHFDLVDSTRGTGLPPEIIEPAAFSDTVPILIAVPANIMTVSSRGIEVQAFLPEIPFARTRIHVTGQWIETKQFADALYFGSARRFGQFALQALTPRVPYWGPVTELGRRALFTYRVIHHQPALGLVLTGSFQHNVFDHLEDLAARDSLAFEGYVTRAGELVEVPRDQRGDPQFRDLHLPRPGTLTSPRRSPADWLLSVQVSKTLPLGGRFSFWAFNALDRIGTFGSVEVASRVYPPARFGLELMMPLRGLAGWAF